MFETTTYIYIYTWILYTIHGDERYIYQPWIDPMKINPSCIGIIYQSHGSSSTMSKPFQPKGYLINNPEKVNINCHGWMFPGKEVDGWIKGDRIGGL